jgi:hypothetical protein
MVGITAGVIMLGGMVGVTGMGMDLVLYPALVGLGINMCLGTSILGVFRMPFQV